ncbi:hypothetical protein EW661_23450, partial [Escherichia coli]|uniref:hypothetical protein n=1 Tax=Escherichia coli TaxID=562 RepID=UPI001172DA01
HPADSLAAQRYGLAPGSVVLLRPDAIVAARWHRFDAAAVARRLPEATVFMGVPTLYTRLLQEPVLDCRRMRLFISGSAPLL